MKNKSLFKTIISALIFALTLCGLAACQKNTEPGLGGDPGASCELLWLPPIFYNGYFIFALLLGVAVLALTVFMAVRIIREKRADKQAERKMAEEKWKEHEKEK